MAEENQIPLPTANEIKQLPRWARVAFAGRCAHRVLPLFKHFWPKAPEQHSQIVCQAVRIAENTAHSAGNDTFDAKAAHDAYDAVHHTTWIAQAGAAKVAVAAAVAAGGAAGYSGIAHDGAATEAARAADAIPGAGEPTRKAIVADFNTLKQLAETHKWTDDTPVPPSVFGPLWPEGAPAGWPAIEEETVTPAVVVEAETTATNNTKPAEKPKRLGVNLQFLVRGDVPADEIAKDIFELYAAMNEQNLAHGGPGLTIEEFRFLIGTPVGAGVR